MEEILISEYNSAELLLEKSKRAGLTGENLEKMDNFLLEIGERVFAFDGVLPILMPDIKKLRNSYTFIRAN